MNNVLPQYSIVCSTIYSDIQFESKIWNKILKSSTFISNGSESMPHFVMRVDSRKPIPSEIVIFYLKFSESAPFFLKLNTIQMYFECLLLN